MRLDFKTLWVEDQPNAVADQSAEIAERMAEDGFDFQPVMCRSLDEAKAQVSEPPRDCRRLQLLRRWSHDKQDNEQILT